MRDCSRCFLLALLRQHARVRPWRGDYSPTDGAREIRNIRSSAAIPAKRVRDSPLFLGSAASRSLAQRRSGAVRSAALTDTGLKSIATVGTRLRDWPKSHRAELRLCFRVTTSAVLTLVVSQLFHLRLAIWAVLTAVLLT